MTKREIADVLNDISTLLELRGENPFKIRAYSNGARKLETLEENLDELIVEGKLADIQGFGKALVEKIETLHADGKLEFYEKLPGEFATLGRNRLHVVRDHDEERVLKEVRSCGPPTETLAVLPRNLQRTTGFVSLRWKW